MVLHPVVAEADLVAINFVALVPKLALSHLTSLPIVPLASQLDLLPDVEQPQRHVEDVPWSSSLLWSSIVSWDLVSTTIPKVATIPLVANIPLVDLGCLDLVQVLPSPNCCSILVVCMQVFQHRTISNSESG